MNMAIFTRKVRTWIDETPGILEGIGKEAIEKFGARFCVAQTLTSPKEGKMTVHQGNFSEKSITLKPGKGQFHPLDPVQDSVNSFHVDSSASENTSFKPNQSHQGPKASLDESVWKTGIRADYSGLSIEQQTSFADLLEEYQDYRRW